jgi:purine nucleoside phosphorylase
MLPMRIAILGVEAKNFISCPHIWNLKSSKNNEDLKAGDLFVVKDYASISAQNPGIGQNIDEYGPRFFDISTMFDSKFTTLIETTIADNSSVKSVSGDIFWVNNSAVVHGTVFNKMAESLSNDRVKFKGLTKTGVPELMAV